MEQKILFGHLGNGVAVWTDSGGKSKPDFEAHIQPTREITYITDNAPQYFINAVKRMAKSGNMVLNCYSTPCLALLPANKPTKYCDTWYYGRKLICEEIVDGEKVLCMGRQVVNDWKRLRDYDPTRNDAVYFIIGRYGKGAYRCYGYSTSEETAQSALADFKHEYCDIGYDIQVERHDEKFLLECGERAGYNLDFDK